MRVSRRVWRRRHGRRVRVRVHVWRWEWRDECGPPEVGGLGETLLLEYGRIAATVRLTDPARGASELESPSPGYRFVAVTLEVRDRSSSPVASDAAAIAIRGENEQTYRPDDDATAGCTDFPAGDLSLQPGASLAGCVSFELPQEIDAWAIEYRAGSGPVQAVWYNTAAEDD